MNTLTDGVMLLIVLGGGMFCFLRGLKAKKRKGFERVGGLYLVMAFCAFIFILLGTINHIFRLTHSPGRIILVMQGFDTGVWFGVFLAMRILKLLEPIIRS